MERRNFAGAWENKFPKSHAGGEFFCEDKGTVAFGTERALQR
jgi:hypothetical protein